MFRCFAMSSSAEKSLLSTDFSIIFLHLHKSAGNVTQGSKRSLRKKKGVLLLFHKLLAKILLLRLRAAHHPILHAHSRQGGNRHALWERDNFDWLALRRQFRRDGSEQNRSGCDIEKLTDQSASKCNLLVFVLILIQPFGEMQRVI